METFLLIGVAIVTRQRMLWPYQVRIVMPTGANHSPPGDKFQKSGDPHATAGNPSEIKIPMIKLHPNEAFSISIKMIFDVDSNCVQPRS